MNYRDLKSKWYYRLLSVSYVLILSFLSLFVIWISFDSIGNHQEDNRIKCYLGNQENFLAYKDKKILVNRFAEVIDSKNWSSNEAPNDWSVMSIATDGCGLSNSMAKSFLDENMKIFSVSFEKVNVYSWQEAIFNIFLLIILIFLILEIIRRIFYFVVIGKIFPDKE